MRPEEFDKLYCNKLNPQQLEAVHSVDGPVLLLAVPGSGKTTVLVTRLGYMVLCKNIAPCNILTMTYTVAATQEMRSRFAENFGADYARAGADLDGHGADGDVRHLWGAARRRAGNAVLWQGAPEAGYPRDGKHLLPHRFSL